MMKSLFPFLSVTIFLFSPTPVEAHAFGQSYNLPVPFWLYAYGAAGAILVSFVVIGYFAGQNTFGLSYPSLKLSNISLSNNSRLILALRAFGLFLFSLTVIAGLFGTNNSYLNISMTLFWIVFVLGLTYLTAILGNIYHFLNPWRTIADILEGMMGAAQTGSALEGSQGAQIIKYPKGLAYFPALIFYFLFIWIELFAQTTPFSLGAIICIYTFVNVIGITVFGKHDWLKYGEFFGVFFRLLGRAASIEYKAGKLYLRPPFVGLRTSKHVANFSLLLFILFMLSSTAFDGFAETTPWYRFYWGMVDEILRPLVADFSYDLFQAIGLLVSPLFFLAIYVFFIWVSKLMGRSRLSVGDLCLKFAFSLIPIALAYNIAHYYTLLITQGMEIIRLISDPFGAGWNLLGTANFVNPFSVLDASFVWHSQVAVILVGHIAGVWLSHTVALKVFSGRKKALLSQIPLLFLMVIYTVIGLWILSQPITSGL